MSSVDKAVNALDDLVDKKCLIGLSYFDVNGALLQQSQLCGTVVATDHADGIAVQLNESAGAGKPAVFMLPPDLSAWFHAPVGRYRDAASGVAIDNPDFLVTWDVHKTKKDTPQGQHEWWQWIPRTAPPDVGPR